MRWVQAIRPGSQKGNVKVAGTKDISKGRETAKSRTFLLWLFTTLLIAMFMAACPTFAFAEDEQAIPDGVLTFDSSQEDLTAIPEGAITFDTVETNDVVEDASIDVQQQEESLDVSQEADIEAPTVEANAELAADEELAKNQTTVDSNQQAEVQEPDSNITPDSETQVTAPASNDDAIEEPSVIDAAPNAPPATDEGASTTEQSNVASTNTEVNNNAQSVDEIAAASNGLSSSSASSDSRSNDSIASNKEIVVQGTNDFKVRIYFDGYFMGSDAGDTIKADSVYSFSLDSVYAMDPADDFNYYKIKSSSWYSSLSGVSAGSNYIEFTASDGDNDSGETDYSIGLLGFARRGSIFSSVYIPDAPLTKAQTADVSFLTMYRLAYGSGIATVPAGTTFTMYVVWQPDPSYDMYVNISSEKEATNSDLTYSVYDIDTDVHPYPSVWDTHFALPGSAEVESYLSSAELAYLADHPELVFAGYVLEDDSHVNSFSKEDDTLYVLVDGYKNVFNPDEWGSSYTYDDVYGTVLGGWDNLGWYQDILWDGDDDPDTNPMVKLSLILRAVFKVKTDEDRIYTVTYKNVDASGNDISSQTDQELEVTHGNKDPYTEKTITKPSDFKIPSENGYSFEFAGWSKSAVAPSASPSVDYAENVSLSGVGGTGTPENDKSYTLYAVWKKTVQKYTVVYNSNGWKTSITESNLEVPSAATPTVKAPATVWGEDRTGWQFDGWNTKADGSGDAVDVGRSYYAAFDPQSGETYTLYAQWTEKKYTIIFNYDSATTAPSTTQFTNTVGATSLNTADPTADVPVYKTNLTKTGYVFDGWSWGSSAGGTKVANADNSIITGSSLAAAAAGDTVNLTAIWKEITYTVNWYAKWTVTSSTQPESGATATSGPYKYTVASSTNLDTLGSASSMDSLKADVTTTESGKDVKYTWAGWYVVKSGSSWKGSSGITAVGSSMTVADVLAVSGADVNVDETACTGIITIFGVWAKSDGRNITYIDQNGPGTGGAGGKVDTVYNGAPYRITYVPTDVSGYTFGGWTDQEGKTYTLANIQKTGDDGTNQLGYNSSTGVSSVTKPYTLTAIWNPNTVQFRLNSSISGTVTYNYVVNPPSFATASVGDTVKASNLSSGPELDGYDFAGWARTSGGTVIIGPGDTDATYTVDASDAPSNPTTIDLFAIWTPWTYTVRYHKNEGNLGTSLGADSSNPVNVYMQTATGNWTVLGGQITTDPYEKTTTDSTLTGWATPGIILTRDWYEDRQYVKWVALKSNSTYTSEINDGQTLATIYSSTSRTDRIIDLYAVWNPIMYTVNYDVRQSGKGTVTPLTETINLATGLDSDVHGSTATVTASGYELDVPTWTDVNGNPLNDTVRPISTSATQETYRPSISFLRSLYTDVPSSTSCTFYANFTEAKFGYKVQAFMQKADGSWDSVWTDPNDLQWSQIGTTVLEAKLNSTVSYSDVVPNSTVTAMNGKTFADLALIVGTTSGISNEHLYVFDTSRGTMEITITSTPADNIIKLYYKRVTYELTAKFQTKEKSTSTATDGAPTSVTTAASDYVNDGAATTTVRWGESIKLTAPSASGYTFAWAATTPSRATSTVVQPTSSSYGSFVLNASDMDKLVTAGQNKAVLTGTFTGISYIITLVDATSPPSTKKWDTSTAGTALKTSGTASTTVTYTDYISDWLPNSIDDTDQHYYLSGWRDSVSNKVIAVNVLRSTTNWTENHTYTAVWLEKILISYDPGTVDSNGDSKAAWVAHTKSFTDSSDPGFNPADPGSSILANTGGKFATLVGSVDTYGNPLGADGWEFDFWTVDTDDVTLSRYRYGHVTAYTGTDKEPNGTYLDATDGACITLSKSWKFIANWKPKNQAVYFVNSGPVTNNTANTSTVTTVLQNVTPASSTPNTTSTPTKTYTTDEELDLSLYEPLAANIPNGYEFAGWHWVVVDKYGDTTAGDYAAGTKFHVKNGINSDGNLVGSTTLSPLFKEKTVTFYYEIDPLNPSRGNITPTTSDTVFVVTHNGINAHKAESTNTDAYSFAEWTYNSGQVTTDDTINATKMNIVAGSVLEGDRTYYAYFDAIQYKLTFTGTGTVGTSTWTVTVSGAGSQIDNSFKVDYGSTIPSGGVVTVDVPVGYELDGWIEDAGPTQQTFSGSNPNLQGVYNYIVTRNVTLTAHFKESEKKEFTVYYNYDPKGVSGFSGSGEASRSVAWGDGIYPSITVSQPGYTFDGWYIVPEYTTGLDVASVGNKFGTVYNKLDSLGKIAPNFDPNNKSITIYGKWTPDNFNVAYDLYGKADGIETPDDGSVQLADGFTVTTKTDVNWNDLASGFKLASGPATFLRPGYTLKGWYATYTVSGVTTESSSDVQNSDTYGTLAGGDASHKTVTLHALWESALYTVEYSYDDSKMTGTNTATSSWTVSKGWAEAVDYYTLGNAPDYSALGYKFNGYTLTYSVVKPTAGTVTGTPLTTPENKTIRDMVGGDATALGSSAVIRLKATWTKESEYYFQDYLVHFDGTSTAPGDTSSTEKVDGGFEVVFNDKYKTSTSKYEDNGYDFDNFTDSSPNWHTTTPDKLTITEGASMEYPVYFIERAYTIDFYTESGSKDYTTTNSPWESAAAKLPTVPNPTKAGYTFDGWYLTTTGDPDDGVKLTGTNTIRSTGLYSVAPAKGATLTAVAKWIEDTVTIQWAADAHGSVNPFTPDHVDIAATSSAAFNVSGATYIEGVPEASGDYVFEKWTYEYTDPSDTVNPVKTGQVTALSPFATLSGTDGYMLTPVKWAMHDGETAVWHDIKFTAHFALSTALTVTINYHYEDANETSTTVSVKYPIKNTVTKRDAESGVDYVVTPEGVLDGYTLNEGLTKSEASNAGAPVTITTDGKIVRMYDFGVAATQVFDLYFDADDHTVTYKYVLTDGVTEQTITGAPALSTFNNNTFKTGQKHTVSAAPTLQDYEFDGWYLSTAYAGTNPQISGMEITIGANDVLIVGTWKLKSYTVNFTKGNSAPAGCSVTQIGGGYTVEGGKQVKTATPKAAGVTGDAVDLQDDLDVRYSGTGYTVTSWKVFIGGSEVGEVSGANGPLTYVVHDDVVFHAVWSETYTVTYSRGAHGNFTDTTNGNITVVYPSKNPGDALPAYTTKGSLDSNSKPNAVDGWEWVGWGVNTGSTWTYYFADETDENSNSIIDYNGSTGTHLTVADMPTTVTSNIEFVGFYKALVRHLIFSMHEYDSGVAAGTESTKTFADDPQPTLASDIASTYDVRTGQYATMLDTDEVVRAGFTLTGWTDGTYTYTPGSTNQFRMPDGPTTQNVYLYPVYSFVKVVINYDVASDSTGRGDVDKRQETLDSPTATPAGSNPVAAPGYEFDYWTLGTDTAHLTSAEGLQSDGKLIPVGATGTLTYYVHFKAKTYDITLAKNVSPVGDNETLPTPDSFTGKLWNDEITLGTPTRNGYTFTGWDVFKTDEWTAYAADPENVTKPTAIRTGIAAGTPKVSALSDANGNATKLTLVPTWTAKSYKVIFNDGKTTGTGTVTGMPSVNPRTCEFESEDIDATNPTRDGYDFAGWANSVNSAKNVAKDVTTLKYYELVDSESDMEVTLTAIWTPKAHTLKYIGTNGTWSTDTSKYPAGDDIFTGVLTDPAAAMDKATDVVVNLRTGDSIARAGWKLMGWKYGTTEYLFSATSTFTMPDDDVELTPIWQESGDYNVLFEPDATDVLSMPGDRTNIPFSTNDINMSEPSRAGWTFDGWDVYKTNSPWNKSTATKLRTGVAAGTGKAYTELVSGDDTIKSVTLVATWTQSNDYKVTFDKNASELVTNLPMDRDNLKWGDTVTTLQEDIENAGSYLEPGRAGYIFQGWTIKDSDGNVLGGTDDSPFTAGSALFSELAQGQDLATRHHLTLVAKWEPKTFTVEFVENKPTGATGTVSGIPATNPVTGKNFDSTITVPNVSLPGYQFKGWTNSATSAVIQANDYLYSVLAGNRDSVLKVTLTAMWEANPHTLTYEIVTGTDTWSSNASDYPVSEPAVNGAANPTAAIATKTDASHELRLATSVSRPGSTLVGWKDINASGDEQVDYLFANGDISYTMPDRDVILKPIWDEDKDYAVNFLPGDSEGATKVKSDTMPANQSGLKYSATDIDTHEPTRPGYIFDGWANDAGTDLGSTVTSTSYKVLVNNNATKKTVNLTAKWIKDTNYKVSYKDGVPSDSTVYFTGTLPVDVPSLGFDDTVKQTRLNADGTERIGFTFTGWKVTNDATGDVITTVTSGYADTIYSAVVSGDATIRAITFTAMWEGTPYTVTYHKEDGTWATANITDEGKLTPDSPLTRKTEQDVDLRLADTLTRDGYTLVGWANGTDNTAAGYVAYRFASVTSFSMPAHNVDLYPLWDAKTYTIYFVEKPVSDTGSIAVDSSSMPTPNPQTGEYQDTFTYGAPTRTGYDFGGWDVFKTDEYDADPTTASLLVHVGEGSGTYASLAGSASIDALTMVAIWTPMKLGVTYVLDVADKATWVKDNIKDAGKDTPSMLISYETDQTVNLREADTVSRAGYVLIGWKEDNSPTVTTAKYPFDADGHASFVMPATNVVLYAVWQIKDDYSVEFDGWGNLNSATAELAPGVTLENVPDDQPIAPAKLTWEGSTSFVDTHSPTLVGYTFKGWDVYGSDGVKISTTSLIGPGYYFNTLALTDTPEHEHLTLKAVWEIARDYNVYFKDGVDTDDTPVTTGTMPTDQTGITYVTVVDYHAPSRIGYTFDGWDVNDITVATDIQALSPISAADAGSNPYYVLAGKNSARKKLELTARWIEKTGYNVHFVDKPASDTGVTPVDMGTLTDYIDIAWDDDVIAWPAPTRTGYDFQWWAVTDTTDPDNVVSIGTATDGRYKYSELARDRSDDTIMDITMTAIWKAHEWNVTYVNSSTIGTGTWMKANITDAGKNTPDAPVTYAVDTTIDLRDATTLVISGYKLVGWQEGETSPTNTYRFADGDTSFYMPDRDVYLYPIWEPKEYKVIFDANKPAEATDPSQIVTGMPVTQWEPSDAEYPMTWNGDVDTKHPTLVGYEFTGWIIENASETGALTGLLNGTTYTFGALALTDTLEHETIKLIAQWRAASYRVNYVDPIDGTGTALATPVLIATDDTKLWVDTVDDSDPWTVSSPVYTGKSSDDWHFNGWMVLDATTNTYVAISSASDLVYKTLAAYENMTVADVATINQTPALVLYASWTRRVPFVVDFMKRDGAGNDTLEDSTTLVGLDGQVIATTVVDEISTTWKDYVLNTVGPDHKIAGYEYSYTLSSPYVTGTLDATATDTLHVKLIYTQLADYTIVYDANPGALVADPTKHTDSKGNLTWESAGSTFPPTDSDWFYVGHKIDGWTYGPTGVEYTFGPTVTFEEIARAIYGTVDGTEGRDADGDGTIAKPVTIYAKWVDRTDYKVKYDDNYAVNDDVVKSNITDGRFLERVADATYTPATKDNVGWSATDIEPTDTDDIVKPGVKDGKELYEIEGWNYLSKDGYQKPAEGLSYAEIFADMYDTSDPESDSIRTITLYARYKEISIKLIYTPVLADDDGNILSMGGSAAGTVSRTLETPDVVTGTILGSTATPNRGYHFIGWRRLSDNVTIYTSEALASMGLHESASGKAGFNVMPDGLGGATLLLAAQNADDGYWHDEEYLALFVQNETAILHYDKNAEDATGYIADVEAPYETLIDLSDGSGYSRKYWTLVSWNTEPDGSGTTYALGETGWEMPQGETTLYAQWVKNKASLTYYPGGDDVTGIPEGITDEWGTTHPISTQTPKRDHYTFKGWNTKEDGTGTWYYGGDEIELPGDGLPLYAQWEINKYTVTIDPGPYTGGKVTYTDGGKYTIEHGGYLPEGYVTADPIDGYRVVGWRYTMTDEYGNVTTGIVDDPTKLQIIGNVTFSAIFEEIPEEPTREASDGDDAGVPRTGDDQMLVIYAGVAVLAMIILVVAARRRREEKEE